MFRRLVAAAVVAALGMAVFTVSATAGSAVTKMKFELGGHEVAAGAPLSGSVSVWARDGSSWSPLVGASLSVTVDGTVVGTLTTDVNGWAPISWPAAVAEGGHVMKIVFGGDAASSKSQRAQGFQVTEAAPVTGTVPEAPSLSATAGSGSVVLAWTVPADGGSPLLAYNIYRGATFGAETLYASVPATQTSFTDIAVLPGASFYHVTAVNAVGESAHSNMVLVS
jgi:hypothetical protein